jgi:hypothetical protein
VEEVEEEEEERVARYAEYWQRRNKAERRSTRMPLAGESKRRALEKDWGGGPGQRVAGGGELTHRWTHGWSGLNEAEELP